jgi:ATP-dependent Clp protease ATP-binding subunit ClpA
LTLGDNRRVDFSRAMIFMTSNLGAHEMSSILMPKLGFQTCMQDDQDQTGRCSEKTTDQITRSAIEAARRKFTPEFMNRIDKAVVFKPLGAPELDKILTLELNAVQQRIFLAQAASPFVFSVSACARGHLLTEGTDLKYGARHLKRAIERALVNPLSNLVASGQVGGGDHVKVDFDESLRTLTFVKEAENLPPYMMAQMIDPSAIRSANLMTLAQSLEQPKAANARSRRA